MSLRSFFNRITGQATSELAPQTTNSPLGRGGYQYLPKASPDSRQKKALEYCPGRLRAGRVLFDSPPPIALCHIQDVLREVGELLDRSDVARLSDLAKEWAWIDGEFAKFSFGSTRARLTALISQRIDVAISKCLTPETGTPSFEELQRQTQLIRDSLHRKRIANSQSRIEIFARACERFDAAAWRCFERCLKRDRDVLGRLMPSFRPSHDLIAFAALFLKACDPIADAAGSGFFAPIDPASSWDYLISIHEPAAAGQTIDQRQVERARQRDAEAQRVREIQAREEAEKAAKVAELNKFHDAIRENKPTDYRPDRPASAKTPAAAEPETTEAK